MRLGKKDRGRPQMKLMGCDNLKDAAGFELAWNTESATLDKFEKQKADGKNINNPIEIKYYLKYIHTKQLTQAQLITKNINALF